MDILKPKSFALAVRIINVYKYLTETKKEFVISKQMLRSGTSVGANVRESKNAASKKDFINKLQIAQKECDETLYWLELLEATKYISTKEFESLNKDFVELLKIIMKSIITAKKNLKNDKP